MCRVVVHVPRLETLQVKIDLMILLCLGCSLLVRVVWFVVLCPIQLSTVVCLPLDMILASCFDRTPMSLRLYLRVLLFIGTEIRSGRTATFFNRARSPNF